MIFAEIANALILVWSHKTSRIFVLLIIFVSLLLSIFFSIFASVIILTCYLSGCIASFCLVKYQYEVGFCLHRLVSIYHSHLTPKRKYERGCNICDNANCNRHQTAIIKEPWKRIRISNELNEAIEDFFNTILSSFISSWYKNLTDDETFLSELRISIKYATSTIINRYDNIDLGKLITNKLIPCASQHIYDCLKIQEKSTLEKRKLEKVAIEVLGRRLHAAVTNRENELEYLKHLTNCLLPYVLPKSELNCNNFNVLIREILSGWVLLPMMDCIADPNVMNLLLNITFEYKRKHDTVKKRPYQKKEVEFLCNFNNYEMSKAALGQDLSKILKSQRLLYVFMQFLKEQGPVHILQFCLDIEEFNKKLLTPELSNSELEKLHGDAMKIYEVYMKETSVDCIGCPADVRNHLYYLLQSGPHNITKLRTSTPLYMAYDYAFNELETKWLPLFNHSEEFYKEVCGPRVSSSYNKSSAQRKKYIESGGQGAVSKISSSINRIKGALKAPQPIEGSVYQSDAPSFETVPSLFIEPNIYRDLSTWRVSIAHVEHVPGTKAMTTFHINVKRIDACSESERTWTVQRQDQDFYTLKIKLVEFHGENEICDSPLPSRRSSTPVETRRSKYEEFLQRLLQKPSLRGSDLLHTFLTTEQNFTLLADTSMPIVSDLGNIYQSVAHKLRKEKGQHLDSFMNTFLHSTENEKSKLMESADVGVEADTGLLVEGAHAKTRNIKNSIFGDNFGIPFPEESHFSHVTFRPCDIIQSFSYLLRNIFQLPQGVLRLFLAICNVAHDAVEYIARIFIEHQIKSNLSQHTLAHLIYLLKDILFIDKFTPPTKQELEERKSVAFNNLSKMKKGLLTYLLGVEISKGLTVLLQILQSPQLNKQLAYSLFDIIILELYPDCNLNKSSNKH